MSNVFTARILKNTETESTFTGNGATEETLNELKNIIAKAHGISPTTGTQTGTTGTVKETQKQTKVLEELGKSFRDKIHPRVFDSLTKVMGVGSAFYKATTEGILNSADRIRLFGGVISDVTMSLTRLNTDISSLSGTINSLGGTTSNFITSLGSMMGRMPHVISQVMGNIIRIGASTIALTMDQLAMINNINKDLYNSSLIFNEGITGFAELAKQAQIPVEQFSQYLANANSSLRFFEGGAVKGVEQISEAISIMRDTNTGMMEHMFRIGYSTEDVVKSMADYAARANMLGQSLDARQLAESTRDYMVNLRELSRLTGVSVEEARSRAEQARADLFTQRAMQQIPEEFRSGVQNFVNNLPEHLRPMEHFFLTGQIHTREAGLILAEMPELMWSMYEHAQGLSDGTVTATESAQVWSETLEENREIFDRELSGVINRWGVTVSSNLPDATLLGNALATSRQIMENATNFANASETISGEGDALGATLGKVQNQLDSSVSRLQNFLLETFLFSNPESINDSIDRITGATEGIIDGAEKFRDSIEPGNLFDIAGQTLGAVPNSVKLAALGSIYGLPGIIAGAIVGQMMDEGNLDGIDKVLSTSSGFVGLPPYAGHMVAFGYLGFKAAPKNLKFLGAAAGAGVGYAYWYLRVREPPEITQDILDDLGIGHLDPAELNRMQRDQIYSRYQRSMADIAEWEGKSEEERRRRIMQLESRIKEHLAIVPDATIEDFLSLPGLVPKMRSTAPMPREIVREIIEEIMNSQNIGPQSYLADPELKKLVNDTNIEIGKLARIQEQTITELKTIKLRTEQGNRQAGNYYSATA